MTETTMIKINGVSFYCHCKCNVFVKENDVFTCNACGEKYVGE